MKLITHREEEEEEEPDESIWRSWSLTETKKKNLMNLYKEVYHLQRRRGTGWIYTKKLVAYKEEEEEPDEYKIIYKEAGHLQRRRRRT